MSDVTRILSQINNGDPSAAEQLLPLVYHELRRLAAAKMAQEQPGQTLQPTALVHEAYLRIVRPDAGQHWNGRGHFYAAAAEAMRRILVESARRKQALKQGGAYHRVDLASYYPGNESDPAQFLMLDDALEVLTNEDPLAGQLAKLRLIVGLSVNEAGEMLGMPHTTAYRHWTYARAWLQARLDDRA